MKMRNDEAGPRNAKAFVVKAGMNRKGLDVVDRDRCNLDFSICYGKKSNVALDDNNPKALDGF